MDIQALPNQQPVQRTDAGGLALRLNQRVRAQVLDVLGEQVLLDVNGTQMTARVVGADVAELLNQGAQAQFVVAGLNQEAITLKLLGGEQTAEQAPSTALLISNLLKSLGIQSDGANTEIAHALLNQKLELSPQLFAEMQELLAQLPNWTQKDVAFAAALKAAGLPLTPDTLALAKQDIAQLGQLLAELQNSLNNMAHSPNQLEQEAALARLALAKLTQLPLDWGRMPEEIAGRLQTLLSQLGRSSENALGETLLKELPENLVLTLQRLMQVSTQKGDASTAKQLAEVVNSLRAMQLGNATWQAETDTPQWLSFSLPLMHAGQPGTAHTAHLRIAYNQDENDPAINPEQTRMVLQVDLENDEYVQVDVSIVGKQMGTHVKASSDALIGFAQTEYASLEEGLAKLGYDLNGPRYAVKANKGSSRSLLGTGLPLDRLADWEA